jgi:hypothetical protein
MSAANKDGKSKILSDNDLRFDPQREAHLAALCAAVGAPCLGSPNPMSIIRPPAKNP